MRLRIGMIVTTMLMMFLMPVLLLAQSGPEPADPGTSPIQWYTSASGVLVATTFGVSMLKRLFGNVSGFNALPTWLYAVVVAGGLTAFCSFVLGTLPGEPLQLIWQAVFNAAGASGIYEWVNNAGKPLASSAASAGVRVTNPPSSAVHRDSSDSFR